MPTAQRRIRPGVAQRLLSEPQRFQFFQAIRVLEHLFVRRGARVDEVLSQRLRFRSSMAMSFPASEIEQLRAYDDQDEPFTASDEGAPIDWQRLSEIDITPAFMGMLGGRGVLPFGYTERIGERETLYRDHGARAFLDIFNNRALALYYRAWKKHRPAFQYELDRRERFLPLVLALAGLGGSANGARLNAGSGPVYDQSLAYYAASVGQRPLSAASLQRILAEHFGVEIEIEQFVGAWYDVPAEQRSKLGTATAVLGGSALVGARIWQRDLRLRLSIGPLRLNRFEDFLPGGSAAAALAKWLTLFCGGTLEFEVRLILHQLDVRSTGLFASGGGRLGWDAFVSTRPATGHRADAHYLVQPLA